VLFLRYEDIVQDKEKWLSEAYSFVLGVPDINGTYLQKRIQATLADEGSTVLYKLKAGGIQRNLGTFSPQYQSYIKRFCNDNIHFFGYSALGDKENPTAIFKYDEVKE